ncbi:MAG: addiction module antidote protein, HigA family [Spirochaetaceae bacterium]|nr:MAG: addiction module antidote protein, HigA family [Spirochaetaceae bacterium]
MGITAYRLCKDTRMPPTRVSQILKGRRRVTADTALRLSRCFDNSAGFWLGIQNEYDLRDQEDELSDEPAPAPIQYRGEPRPPRQRPERCAQRHPN